MHLEYWKKNISVLAKATQVSDVAHGPLVGILHDFLLDRLKVNSVI
jgi:hypothetical protein